jgi:uncharacterized damage-inducible protein DinB
MVSGVSAMERDYRAVPPRPSAVSRVIYGAGSPTGAKLDPAEGVMSEIDRIWDQLQRSFEGNEAWRCPSLRDLLAGVTAEHAAAHPVAGAPSIWELLLHVTAHEQTATRRLAGEPAETLPDELAWPRPADTSPEAWRLARLAFGEARRALRQAVAGLPDERLADIVPGREYTFYVLLHGAVEHALYHAGQIEMLMVACGVRPTASPMAAHEAPPPRA